MQKLILVLSIALTMVSCIKSPFNEEVDSFLTGNGFFVLNEGNFFGGSGSVSFYSYDSSKVYNNIFQKANGWPVGSIPNSMYIVGNKGYIVVNNSGKIEVVDINTCKEQGSLNALKSPRNMGFVSYDKAYLTSLYSDSVAMLRLSDNSVSGYINLHHTSESIIINGGKAYISNWMGGNKIMIVDTESDKVADSISVGYEPESMVLDKYKKLWVLCNGGWERQNYAKLVVINTTSDEIEKEFVFPDKLKSPTALSVNGPGDVLYYLEKGVHKMSISSLTLPSETLIPENNRLFYKLAINPINEDIVVTDAVDYQQSGFAVLYNKYGIKIDEEKTDIIPGSICFKLNYNFYPR